MNRRLLKILILFACLLMVAAGCSNQEVQNEGPEYPKAGPGSLGVAVEGVEPQSDLGKALAEAISASSPKAQPVFIPAPTDNAPRPAPAEVLAKTETSLFVSVKTAEDSTAKVTLTTLESETDYISDKGLPTLFVIRPDSVFTAPTEKVAIMVGDLARTLFRAYRDDGDAPPPVESVTRLMVNPDVSPMVAMMAATTAASLSRSEEDNKLLSLSLATAGQLQAKFEEPDKLLVIKLRNNIGAMLAELWDRTKEEQLAGKSSGAYWAGVSLFDETTPPCIKTVLFVNHADLLLGMGRTNSGGESLSRAAGGYFEALKLIEKTPSCGDWGEINNRLGLTQLIAGIRARDEELVNESIKTYKSSLNKISKESDPLPWARTQAALGKALEAQGIRQNSRKSLRAAIEAFGKAVEVYEAAGEMELLAANQNRYGVICLLLGERAEGLVDLKEAVMAFNSVLLVVDPAEDPKLWGSAQSNMGHALATWGERSSSPDKWAEAVAAHLMGWRALREVNVVAAAASAKSVEEDLAALEKLDPDKKEMLVSKLASDLAFMARWMKAPEEGPQLESD